MKMNVFILAIGILNLYILFSVMYISDYVLNWLVSIVFSIIGFKRIKQHLKSYTLWLGSIIHLLISALPLLIILWGLISVLIFHYSV